MCTCAQIPIYDFLTRIIEISFAGLIRIRDPNLTTSMSPNILHKSQCQAISRLIWRDWTARHFTDYILKCFFNTNVFILSQGIKNGNEGNCPWFRLWHFVYVMLCRMNPCCLFSVVGRHAAPVAIWPTSSTNEYCSFTCNVRDGPVRPPPFKHMEAETKWLTCCRRRNLTKVWYIESALA